MHKHLHTCELNHLHDCVCIELLGKSNISEVKLYQCKDIHSNKETLIQSNKHCNKLFTVKKMFKKDKLFYKNVDIRNLLLNEFNIGYSVNECIYIRKTYDIDLIDNCIIFEYCDGLDFFEFLEKYNNLNDNLFYFKQLIETVSYLHGKGIAHMDLKLENIMIDVNKKQIKLIDFGDARYYKKNNSSEICLEKGVHGTYEYMSPEMFKSVDYNPEKSDIWACGIIFYELFYNSMPWSIAKRSDSNYNEYENYFIKNNTVLPCMVKYSQFLKEMLNPFPEERCDISVVKNLLSIS